MSIINNFNKFVNSFQRIFENEESSMAWRIGSELVTYDWVLATLPKKFKEYNIKNEYFTNETKRKIDFELFFGDQTLQIYFNFADPNESKCEFWVDIEEIKIVKNITRKDFWLIYSAAKDYVVQLNKNKNLTWSKFLKGEEPEPPKSASPFVSKYSLEDDERSEWVEDFDDFDDWYSKPLSKKIKRAFGEGESFLSEEEMESLGEMIEKSLENSGIENTHIEHKGDDFCIYILLDKKESLNTVLMIAGGLKKLNDDILIQYDSSLTVSETEEGENYIEAQFLYDQNKKGKTKF